MEGLHDMTKALTPAEKAKATRERRAAEKAAAAEGTPIPSTAKKPQDRKAPVNDAKAEATAEETMTLQAGGQDWTVPRAVFDDFEMLADIAALTLGGDPTAKLRAARALGRVLGDQLPVAMNLLRDPKTGRVPEDAGMSFLVELMTQSDPNS